VTDTRIGCYVHPGKIERLAELAKADIVTTILMNLRSIRPLLTKYNSDHSVPVTIHAPYSINIGHRDKFVRDASFGLLIKNAQMAAAIGALGVTFHGGSIRANLDWRDAFTRLADFEWPCDILIENGSNVKGSCSATIGQVYELFGICGRNPRIGMTLDTAHVWAMYHDKWDRELYVTEVRDACLDRIMLVHANGSAAEAGKQLDIHAPFVESAMTVQEVVCLARLSGCTDWVCETRDPVNDVKILREEVNSVGNKSSPHVA